MTGTESMRKPKNFVQNKIQRDFYNNPGEHGWIIGTTGAGKTSFMLEVLRGLKKAAPKETIIWRDYGKESELLGILQFHDIKLFHPKGTTFTVAKMNKKQKELLGSHEIEQFEFETPKDILNNLQKKGVNAIATRRYLRSPKLFINFWSEFFENFINMALNYELPRPLSFFIDEMNNITPADGHAFAPGQSQLIQLLVYNTQNLRALEARLIPSTQGLASLNKGMRLQMQYYFFKRNNEQIDIDIKHFLTAQIPIQRLRKDQIIVAGPSREYSDPISNVPNRLPPKHLLPRIEYGGEYIPPNKETKKDDGLKQALIDFKRQSAINLQKKGMAYSEIANTLDISVGMAYNYCKQDDI